MIPTSLKNLFFFFVSTLFLNFLFGSFFLCRGIITGAGPAQHGLGLAGHGLIQRILHVESYEHGEKRRNGTHQNGGMHRLLFLLLRLFHHGLLLTVTGRLGKTRRFSLGLSGSCTGRFGRCFRLRHFYRSRGKSRLGRSGRSSRSGRSCRSYRSGGRHGSSGALGRSSQRNRNSRTGGSGSSRSHRTRSRGRYRSTGSSGTRRHGSSRSSRSSRTRRHRSRRTRGGRGNRTRCRRGNGARSRGRYGRCAHNIRSVKSATALRISFYIALFFYFCKRKTHTRLFFSAEAASFILLINGITLFTRHTELGIKRRFSMWLHRTSPRIILLHTDFAQDTQSSGNDRGKILYLRGSHYPLIFFPRQLTGSTVPLHQLHSGYFFHIEGIFRNGHSLRLLSMRHQPMAPAQQVVVIKKRPITHPLIRQALLWIITPHQKLSLFIPMLSPQKRHQHRQRVSLTGVRLQSRPQHCFGLRSQTAVMRQHKIIVNNL